MNTIPVYTCPLGAKCEEIRDNKFYRCIWYIQLAGKNPQSEDLIDESKCAIAWLPILHIENSQMTRGVNDAICSMRDETIMRQDFAIGQMLQANTDVKNITSQ